MRSALACLALFVFFSFGGALEAKAAVSTNANNNLAYATIYCTCLVNPNYELPGWVAPMPQYCSSVTVPANPQGNIIQPIADCFTDTNSGIIPLVTQAFLTNTTYYAKGVSVMILFAIVFFGIRLFLGDVQKISTETLILAFKIAGVLYFLNYAGVGPNGGPGIYTMVYNLMLYLSQLVTHVATQAHTTGFCVASVPAPGGGSGGTDTSQWEDNLWRVWDCIFTYLFGWGSGSFAIASIASFLLLMAFSMGTGIIVLFMALFLIFAIFKAVVRFIHVFFMSCLGLSFLFCIGYIFMPLILFRNTYDYFRKWLMMVFGFIITPVMMFAYMGMMLAAVDIVLFSGSNSLFFEIGGSKYGGSGAAGDPATGTGGGFNLFSDIASNIVPASGLGLTGGNTNLVSSFQKVMYMGLNGPPSMGQTVGSVAPTFPPNCTPGSTSFQGSFGQVCGLQSAAGLAGANGALIGSTGGVGTPATPGYAATVTDTQKFPTMTKVGIDGTALNLGNLAASAGSTCSQSYYGGDLTANASGIPFYQCPWITNILIALSVALLVMYIMISLLSYIPTLASNMTTALVSSDFISRAQSGLTGGGFLGGGNSILNAAKSTAQGAAKGVEQGGLFGGLKGGANNIVDAALATGGTE